MKKLFLSVMMVAAVCAAAEAQTVDSVGYNGFNKILYCHKVMTITCQPQEAGYIDSNQIRVTRSYKFTSSETFHTKTAHENFTETLNQNEVKTTADVSASLEYGPFSGTASAGIENDYMSKLVSSTKYSGEADSVFHKEITNDYHVEYQPNKAIQLWECVVNVPGEYNRIYASPKVPDETIIINYRIVVNYNNAVRALYRIIKDCNVGTDQGEWGTFNEIARNAFLNYDNPASGWHNFLTQLTKKLWTNALDQGSWSIIKDAANGALGQRNLVNQFHYFCARVEDIRDPSHNDWAWALITNFAKKYDD